MSDGRFVKGKSGNPGGRPKAVAEVQELARTYTKEAIETLASWMRSNDPKASAMAANSLLDRAWGKPAQSIEHKGDATGFFDALAAALITGAVVTTVEGDGSGTEAGASESGSSTVQ